MIWQTHETVLIITQKNQVSKEGTGTGVDDLNNGCRAFTTMLMFGLNSDSYCTHNAATAAS